jgi:hypothetical protein
VQVILTIILIGIAAAWLVAVQQRLHKLRSDVKAAWKILEPDQSNEAVRTVYNKHVAAYNSALEVFPANVLAPIIGFKQARPF